MHLESEKAEVWILFVTDYSAIVIILYKLEIFTSVEQAPIKLRFFHFWRENMQICTSPVLDVISLLKYLSML